jgi:hypothetical protein
LSFGHLYITKCEKKFFVSYIFYKNLFLFDRFYASDDVTVRNNEVRTGFQQRVLPVSHPRVRDSIVVVIANGELETDGSCIEETDGSVCFILSEKIYDFINYKRKIIYDFIIINFYNFYFLCLFFDLYFI